MVFVWIKIGVYSFYDTLIFIYSSISFSSSVLFSTEGHPSLNCGCWAVSRWLNMRLLIVEWKATGLSVYFSASSTDTNPSWFKSARPCNPWMRKYGNNQCSRGKNMQAASSIPHEVNTTRQEPPKSLLPSIMPPEWHVSKIMTMLCDFSVLNRAANSSSTI